MRSFLVILICTNVLVSEPLQLPNPAWVFNCCTYLHSRLPRDLLSAVTVPGSFPFSVFSTLLPLLIFASINVNSLSLFLLQHTSGWGSKITSVPTLPLTSLSTFFSLGRVSSSHNFKQDSQISPVLPYIVWVLVNSLNCLLVISNCTFHCHFNLLKLNVSLLTLNQVLFLSLWFWSNTDLFSLQALQRKPLSV